MKLFRRIGDSEIEIFKSNLGGKKSVHYKQKTFCVMLIFSPGKTVSVLWHRVYTQ